MQCLFRSADPRVDIVVLELEVLVGWSFILKNEEDMSLILSRVA